MNCRLCCDRKNTFVCDSCINTGFRNVRKQIQTLNTDNDAKEEELLQRLHTKLSVSNANAFQNAPQHSASVSNANLSLHGNSITDGKASISDVRHRLAFLRGEILKQKRANEVLENRLSDHSQFVHEQKSGLKMYRQMLANLRQRIVTASSRVSLSRSSVQKYFAEKHTALREAHEIFAIHISTFRRIRLDDLLRIMQIRRKNENVCSINGLALPDNFSDLMEDIKRDIQQLRKTRQKILNTHRTQTAQQAQQTFRPSSADHHSQSNLFRNFAMEADVRTPVKRRNSLSISEAAPTVPTSATASAPHPAASSTHSSVPSGATSQQPAVRGVHRSAPRSQSITHPHSHSHTQIAHRSHTPFQLSLVDEHSQHHITSVDESSPALNSLPADSRLLNKLADDTLHSFVHPASGQLNPLTAVSSAASATSSSNASSSSMAALSSAGRSSILPDYLQSLLVSGYTPVSALKIHYDEMELMKLETGVAVMSSALGSLVFFSNLLSRYLGIPLPYQQVFFQSYSYIQYDDRIFHLTFALDRPLGYLQTASEKERFLLGYRSAEELHSFPAMVADANHVFNSFQNALSLLAQNLQFLCLEHGIDGSFSHFRYFHFLPNVLLLTQAVSMHWNLKENHPNIYETVVQRKEKHRQNKKPANHRYEERNNTKEQVSSAQQNVGSPVRTPSYSTPMNLRLATETQTTHTNGTLAIHPSPVLPAASSPPITPTPASDGAQSANTQFDKDRFETLRASSVTSTPSNPISPPSIPIRMELQATSDGNALLPNGLVAQSTTKGLSPRALSTLPWLITPAAPIGEDTSALLSPLSLSQVKLEWNYYPPTPHQLQEPLTNTYTTVLTPATTTPKLLLSNNLPAAELSTTPPATAASISSSTSASGSGSASSWSSPFSSSSIGVSAFTSAAAAVSSAAASLFSAPPSISKTLLSYVPPNLLPFSPQTSGTASSSARIYPQSAAQSQQYYNPPPNMSGVLSAYEPNVAPFQHHTMRSPTSNFQYRTMPLPHRANSLRPQTQIPSQLQVEAQMDPRVSLGSSISFNREMQTAYEPQVSNSGSPLLTQPRLTSGLPLSNSFSSFPLSASVSLSSAAVTPSHGRMGAVVLNRPEEEAWAFVEQEVIDDDEPEF